MQIEFPDITLVTLKDMQIGTVFSKPNNNSHFFMKVDDYLPNRFKNVFDINCNQLCTIPENEKFQIREATLQIK